MSKPVKSFRIDQDLIDKAKKQGIDIARLLEETLAKVLKANKCPVCGKRIKQSASKYSSGF